MPITADAFHLFPEGNVWYEKYYHKIIESLGLSEERDIESRDLLSKILGTKSDSFDHSGYERKIRNRAAILIGAGPSIRSDISGLKDYLNESKPFLAAADGATDALLEIGIEPDVIVTDLDSCSESALVRESSIGVGVVVHAHGDNMPLINRIVPKLGSNLLGSTQVRPLQNVQNTGGFTDGDRSCYFLAHYKPRKIIIAGMDFGIKEGEYSVSRTGIPVSSLVSDFKRIKLGWGKKSLESLIHDRPDIRFVNVTRYGEDIKGASKVDYTEVSRQGE